MYDNVEVNSKHVNRKIGYNLLPEEQMQFVGFRKVGEGDNQRYYFCKNLGDDITFNVTLPIPINNDMLDIAILDEEFLQPYDYQRMLELDPNSKYPLEVASKVEKWMDYLQGEGILYGHVTGEYI